MNDDPRDKELAVSIGKRARQARAALGLTQQAAADRIGVSAEFYARIERGNALPSVQTLTKLTSSLSVSAADLLGDVEAWGARAPAARAGKAQPQSETSEVRRIERWLRKASPQTLRLIGLLLKELDTKR